MNVYKINKNGLSELRRRLKGTGTWSYTPVAGGLLIISTGLPR